MTEGLALLSVRLSDEDGTSSASRASGGLSRACLRGREGETRRVGDAAADAAVRTGDGVRSATVAIRFGAKLASPRQIVNYRATGKVYACELCVCCGDGLAVRRNRPQQQDRLVGHEFECLILVSTCRL